MKTGGVLARQNTDAATPERRTRVVLVEDDSALREELADYLRHQGGEVTEAGSGIALYQALRTQVFDIAVIDINLPDTSGYDLIRDIAQERRTGIIALTAMGERNARRRAFEAGADQFLTKPVDGEELLATVGNLARRVHMANGDADAPRPIWRLSRSDRRLVAPTGEVLQLTGREVMLMEQFAHAEGEPIGRAQLGETLGYGPPSPSNRGLDAAIRRLRQKASASNTVLPLQALHSIGLRFMDQIVVSQWASGE